jgi:MFS family permease
MRLFASLNTRNYRLWFFGQSVSQCGTWMQAVAQNALVLFQLHGSALDLGVTAALQFGPVLVLGPVGGLLADRLDKRRLLLFTQAAFTLQALALGALVVGGVVELWMVWALALLMGVINALDNPARQSFVVEMVGPKDLANAVGLNSVVVNSSRMVGPAIAGLLIVTLGIAWTFLLNALSFIAVLAALYAMRSEDLHHSPRVAPEKGQIRAGLRYAWGAWELRVPLLMMAVIGTLAYNFTIILPLLADLFARGAGTYSGLMTAMGIGALLGALTAAARRRPSYRQLVLVAFAFGVCMLAVALAPTLSTLSMLLVPMGAASVLFISTGNSLLQLNSSTAMRGRVMALWVMVFLGSTPIGGPFTGFVASHFGVRFAMGLGAVATLVVALAAALVLYRIRARGRAILPTPAHQPMSGSEPAGLMAPLGAVPLLADTGTIGGRVPRLLPRQVRLLSD